MTEEKEENLDSNDWIEIFRAIKKMHPFVIVFTIAFSLCFGTVFRSDLPLFSKLTVLGAGALLQFVLIVFEAYRIDKEEKQKSNDFPRLTGQN